MTEVTTRRLPPFAATKRRRDNEGNDGTNKVIKNDMQTIYGNGLTHPIRNNEVFTNPSPALINREDVVDVDGCQTEE